MNTDAGRIYSPDEMKALDKSLKNVGHDIQLSDFDGFVKPNKLTEEMIKADRDKKLIEMRVPPTEIQMKRNPPKVGRNEMCPCGSGNKFKKCHWTGHKV